jgi:hypothetical protein
MTTTDATVVTSSSADKNVTSTLQAAVTAGHNGQWLVLIRPQGTMEVRLFVFLSLMSHPIYDCIFSDMVPPEAHTRLFEYRN